MKLALAVAIMLGLGGCAAASVQRVESSFAPSPYLLVFAGDRDEREEDFFAVMDVRPGSPSAGQVVETLPTGMRASMPHHLEYQLPPHGAHLFANAHHSETTMMVDVGNPLDLRIARTLAPPAPFRFGHDFARLANGNVLAGFLRSEGPSPRPGDALVPGGHGGLAEYGPQGRLLRTASAAVTGQVDPIRPYAIVPMPQIDRLVTTSAPMMEDHSADVVQIWRYSDLTLLHTIAVPPGRRANGEPLPQAARFPFGPRLLADGTILMNSFGCGFYRLSGIASDSPRLDNVYTIQVPEPAQPNQTRGACSTPVIVGHYWIMPVGRAQTVIVLDISDPSRPREVSRFDTPADFNPHWAALDPASDRIVVGAELGGEQGMFILRFDRAAARLRFDDSIRSPDGRAGYVDLARQRWPHGESGEAWAHAALFLPPR